MTDEKPTENKAEEKPVALFDTERGEREAYGNARHGDTNLPIKLPLTRDGFDALMEHVCDYFDLPNDDSARQVIAQHVHHIPNDCDETTFEKLGVVLRKSASNALTWGIDQAIKQKRELVRRDAIAKLEADAKAAEAARMEAATANVPQAASDTKPN